MTIDPIGHLVDGKWADHILPPTVEQLDAAARAVARWAATQPDRNVALVEVSGALGLAAVL